MCYFCTLNSFLLFDMQLFRYNFVLIKQLLLFIGFLFGSSSMLAQTPSINYFEAVSQLNLPVINITTIDSLLPTTDYVIAPEGYNGIGMVNRTKVYGRMVMTLGKDVLYDSGEYVSDKGGIMLRLRGNTSGYNSAEYPSYKIKLQKKADLLCRNNKMYNDKEWALLNWFSSTDLKLTLGQQVALLCGIEWEPANHLVNLFINGDYRGLHILTETVKQSVARCNVSDTGFITECDAYCWNTTDSVVHTQHLPHSMGYTFKYPDGNDLSGTDYDYIKNRLNTFEQALYAQQSIDSLFDVSSLAAWFLAHDILGTQDAPGANIFITLHNRDNGTKLRMGPLWDFDSDNQTTSDWAAEHSSPVFYGQQLFNNPTFVHAYVSCWEQVRPLLYNRVVQVTDSMMQNYAAAFDESRRLSIIKKQVEVGNDYQLYNKVNEQLTWYGQRIAWLDAQIQQLSATILTQPTQTEVNYVKVYDTVGRVQFAGTIAAYHQWRKQRHQAGVFVITYLSNKHQTLRTEKWVAK